MVNTADTSGGASIHAKLDQHRMIAQVAADDLLPGSTKNAMHRIRRADLVTVRRVGGYGRLAATLDSWRQATRLAHPWRPAPAPDLQAPLPLDETPG